METFRSSQRFEKRVGTDLTTGINARGATWESRLAIYRTVVAGVELEIDTQGLMKLLGHRAIHNKAGRAKLLGGLVKARITSEKPVDA